MQTLIFTSNPGAEIDALLGAMNPGKVFILADENTSQLVVPKLKTESEVLAQAPVIEIPAGDDHKNLETLSGIWSRLGELKATRTSVLVNVGGGVVTDIGGFAAATFKRGIRFINVPTTLLGAVDAAVGGKTGINFGGYKNEIGAFREADAVVISTVFFPTLPLCEVLSGYAEMIKHALIEGEQSLAELLSYDIADEHLDVERLLAMLERSVEVKRRVVASDPTEKGLRKVLNLGHTIGHALESHALETGRPVPHGFAVAWGLVGELVLSHMALGFPSDSLHQLSAYVRDKYGAPRISCEDYDRLLELMTHDKKNSSAQDINFTLLSAPGAPEINQTVASQQIRTAIDILRDLLGG